MGDGVPICRIEVRVTGLTLRGRGFAVSGFDELDRAHRAGTSPGAGLTGAGTLSQLDAAADGGGVRPHSSVRSQ